MAPPLIVTTNLLPKLLVDLVTSPSSSSRAVNLIWLLLQRNPMEERRLVCCRRMTRLIILSHSKREPQLWVARERVDRTSINNLLFLLSSSRLSRRIIWDQWIWVTNSRSHLGRGRIWGAWAILADRVGRRVALKSIMHPEDRALCRSEVIIIIGRKIRDIMEEVVRLLGIDLLYPTMAMDSSKIFLVLLRIPITLTSSRDMIIKWISNPSFRKDISSNSHNSLISKDPKVKVLSLTMDIKYPNHQEEDRILLSVELTKNWVNWN